jgi:hypothetical protein
MTTPSQRIAQLLDEGARFMVQLPGQVSIDLTPDVIALLYISGSSFKNDAVKEESEPLIEITAWWGNDDVDASLQVTQTEWEDIKNGGEFEDVSSYFYEGQEYLANWRFTDGLVSITGEEGRECILEMPVDGLATCLVQADGSCE